MAAAPERAELAVDLTRETKLSGPVEWMDNPAAVVREKGGVSC